jgi:hypothetical protein
MDIIEWAEQRLVEIEMEEVELRQFLDMAYHLRKRQAAALSGESTPSKQQEIEQTVIKLLRDAGRTLTTQEILQLLGDEGHELSGKDPRNNLAARLSNSKLVKHHQDLGGWWLTGSPVPSSAIDPSRDVDTPRTRVLRKPMERPARQTRRIRPQD